MSTVSPPKSGAAILPLRRADENANTTVAVQRPEESARWMIRDRPPSSGGECPQMVRVTTGLRSTIAKVNDTSKNVFRIRCPAMTRKSGKPSPS
jgi:hypothetical protein